MNETKNNINEEIEIDLRRVLEAVMEKGWVISIVSIICAIVMLLVTIFAIVPEYKASAMFYVNNNSFSVGDASLSISNGDLVTSRGLVESYIVILNTRETLNDVIDYSGADLSYTELKKMISAASVNETEIFEVVVTSEDPNEAEQVANAIAYILPKRISSIIEGTSAKVVDAAVVPTSPSSPSYTRNTMLGFLLGFLASAGVVALQEIFDTTIREEEDIEQVCELPILAAVPDMTAQGKGSRYYGYGKKQGPQAAGNAGGKQDPKQPALVGGSISFAASEAYKLLRTKLQFSFADGSVSHVIGLSSAMSGEGKSLTSINLAYTLSQLDKKVLLIDCDMRRPTLAEKLSIRKKPGLSSYLTGQIGAEELLQYCNIAKDEQAFHVIAAGECPPNPIELLSSQKMENMLNSLRKRYDYIILDLPPVGEVSDAMSIANRTDGMLLVTRQNYCSRPALSDAVRQFQFIDTKLLGLVFNCTGEHSGKYYYRKGYYKKGYDKRYYKRYYGYGEGDQAGTGSRKAGSDRHV